MSNYEMIGAIVVAGLAIMAFTKPILELKSILVKLEETLKNLERMMTSNYEKNEKEHDMLFQQIIDLTDRLARLQDKFTRLETEHNKQHK